MADRKLLGSVVLRDASTGFISTVDLPPGSAMYVRKTSAGWPARPTGRGDIAVIWIGTSPQPPVVASGTGGMRDNLDVWLASSVITSGGATGDTSSGGTGGTGNTGGTTTPAPTITVKATAGDGTATMSWTTSATITGLTGWYVKRSGTDTTGSGTYSTTLSTSATSVSFDKLVNGTTYDLTLAPVVNGVIGTSQVVQAKPAATGALVRATVTNGDAQATISWTTREVIGNLTGWLVGRDGTDNTGYGAYSETIDYASTSWTALKLNNGTNYSLSVTPVVGGTPNTAATASVTASPKAGATDTGGGSTTPTNPSTGSGTGTFVGPRSRLPWYSGAYLENNTGKREPYETGRGRRLDAIATFNSRGSETEMLNPWFVDNCKPVTSQGGLMVLAIPLWAENQSASNDMTNFYNNMANLLNNAGVASQTNMRLGWEMNLPGWNHKVTSGNRTQWVAKFKQASGILKQKCPGLTVSFNPNEGNDQTGVSMADLAKELVGYYDFVGPDYYNWYPSSNSDSQWNSTYARSGGLKFWEDFARSNNKGYTIPEWGGYPGAGSGAYSGDSVLYTQKMVGRFSALANEGMKVLECHFNESASYIADSLYIPNQMPAMASALKSALAAQPTR